MENVDALLAELTGYENRTQHDVEVALDKELHEVQIATTKTTPEEVEVDGTEEVLPAVSLILVRHYSAVRDEVADIHIHLLRVETTLTQVVCQICLS